MRRSGLNTGLFAQAMLLSSICAHHLAGGELISLQKMAIGYLVIVMTLAKVQLRDMTGPKLALTIVAVQSLGHIYFGSTSSSNSKMALAHIFAGLACYAFTQNQSSFLEKSSRILGDLFIPIKLQIINFRLNHKRFISTRSRSFNSGTMCEEFGMRAPPSGLMTNG
jgi:hypothetical protein